MQHSVNEIHLSNGAKGLLIDVPGASVMSFYINFRAGDYLAPRAKWEAPHVMEHLLLGANKKIPKARDFQANFEKNGAYSNASTGTYDITYEAECADFEWKRILECMVVALTEPLFLEDEFKAEIGNVREELSARSNNHFQQLGLALKESYGLHAITWQERLKLLSNVTLEDLVLHYKKTHHTSNMRFIIAGNLKSNRRTHIKNVFKNIKLPKGKGRKNLPYQDPNGLVKPLFIPNDTIDNYYFYIDTFLKRRMSDPELHAMSLLNSMLTETLHSKIWGAAREHGLLYGMSSNVSYDQNYTNWWFGAQVRPDNAPAVMSIVVSELLKVFDGKISLHDVKSAQQYSLGRFQRSAQTVSGLAHAYLGRYFQEDFIEDFYAIPECIKGVTKSQMVEGARDLFSEKNWGFGVLGGTDKRPVDALHRQISPLW
jgi:predicted Zn-dependent peptidase